MNADITIDPPTNENLTVEDSGPVDALYDLYFHNLFTSLAIIYELSNEILEQREPCVPIVLKTVF